MAVCVKRLSVLALSHNSKKLETALKDQCLGSYLTVSWTIKKKKSFRENTVLWLNAQHAMLRGKGKKKYVYTVW